MKREIKKIILSEKCVPLSLLKEKFNVKTVYSSIHKLKKEGYNIHITEIDGEKNYCLIEKEPEIVIPEKQYFYRKNGNGLPFIHYIIEEDSIYIFPLGDFHISNNEMQEMADKIMETVYNGNGYIILGGDLLEMGTKYSIADGVYRQKLSPNEQLKAVDEIIGKYSPRILAILNGNHEDRVSKEVGIDILKVVAEKYSIPYFYGAANMIIETNKRKTYLHVIHHVKGVKTNSKMKGIIENSRDNFPAQIYIAFHGHEGLLDPNQIRVIFDEKKLETARERIYGLMNPSLLSYYGSYADKNGYRIPNNIFRKINISGKNYTIEDMFIEKNIR